MTDKEKLFLKVTKGKLCSDEKNYIAPKKKEKTNNNKFKYNNIEKV